MPITQISSTGNSGSASTTCSVSGVVISSNQQVVLQIGWATNHTLVSVTDTLSNTYIQAPGAFANNSGAATSTDIWYCLTPNAGTATITAAFSGSNDSVVAVQIYSGIFNFTAATNQTQTSSNPVSPSLTATKNNELLVSLFEDSTSSGPTNVDSPWNLCFASGRTCTANILATTGGVSYQAQFTPATNKTGCSSIAGFSGLIQLSLTDSLISSEVRLNSVSKPLADNFTSTVTTTVLCNRNLFLNDFIFKIDDINLFITNKNASDGLLLQEWIILDIQRNVFGE